MLLGLKSITYLQRPLIAIRSFPHPKILASVVSHSSLTCSCSTQKSLSSKSGSWSPPRLLDGETRNSASQSTILKYLVASTVRGCDETRPAQTIFLQCSEESVVRSKLSNVCEREIRLRGYHQSTVVTDTCALGCKGNRSGNRKQNLMGNGKLNRMYPRLFLTSSVRVLTTSYSRKQLGGIYFFHC